MKMFDDCGKGKLLHFEQSRFHLTRCLYYLSFLCLCLRVYLEFERPKSSRQHDSGSTPVLDAVYIALKKRCSGPLYALLLQYSLIFFFVQRHIRGESLELFVNEQQQARVIKAPDQQQPRQYVYHSVVVITAWLSYFKNRHSSDRYHGSLQQVCVCVCFNYLHKV